MSGLAALLAVAVIFLYTHILVRRSRRQHEAYLFELRLDYIRAQVGLGPIGAERREK